MNIEWEPTPNGLSARIGTLFLIVGKSKHGHWSWEVNAPDVDDDVQGRAYSLELAKVYAEACALALLARGPAPVEDATVEYRDIVKEA
jgi:hypothetical protein